ncbi:MAG: UDP-glucose 4-epimerase GalE [Candidatus Improbicoccus pseudotrichonymphae]|uniref:UDP-glucose 4-epimerase n=1 Tax=Candidatus Improbicoccus pseudotrichonymphae TaxID=3033792 RepID=A0AA48HXZ3_9FIRM|nr:MAG: UDP-glucose 4-epimerase GalE [Candidatus Improbicoccus pseudotrichonymphae]
MKILVTGAAGYIGSHTVLALIENNYKVVGIDNFCNSYTIIPDILREISGKRVIIHKIDIRNQALLRKIFEREKPDAVIHFAGLKSVSESVKFPLLYYENNVLGTINLCKIMQEFNVKKIIFSSSATVYGDQPAPFVETMSKGKITSPYGKSKSVIEDILKDLSDWSVIILRYFNPIGAHPSGLLGEMTKENSPNNLMPYILKVAKREHKFLNVFGGDYPTKDGTCIRDYIHVMDLAYGHLKALKYAQKQMFEIFNLGTGQGTSVLELIKTFEDVNKIKINYEITKRRPGDVAESFACCDKSKKQLSWETKLDIKKMCEDSWRFFKEI